MRAALVQLTVSDDPVANLPVTVGYIRQAVAAGAGFVLTPELTNGLSSSRAHQRSVFRHEEDDATLAALRAEAQAAGIWLLIGSLGLLTHDADGRFANRSFLIAPDGGVAARYDKIHMFDVNVSATEVYRESEGYRPGTKAVVAATPFAKIGMTVCYDLRFPALYRRLAQGGAQVITVPAAFNHIGRHCCGPGPSRPAVSCWLQRRPAFTRKRTARAARPTGIRWPSRPGARCWPMPGPGGAGQGPLPQP